MRVRSATFPLRALLLVALHASPLAAGERKVRPQFRRSVVAAVEIAAGSTIEHDMLCIKRPGDGIPPHELGALVGRRARREFRADEQLQWEEVE